MHKIEKLFLSAIVVVGLAIGLVVSASTANGQHTVRLPQPTGPFRIGTTSFALVDEARPEVFTDNPDDKRSSFIWLSSSALRLESVR